MSEPRVLQNVVMPLSADPDTLSLYVTFGEELVSSADGGLAPSRATGTPGASGHTELDNVLSRRAFRVTAGTRASFATYFGAFPASYWRRWTSLRQVELRLSVDAAATVVVHRSNATGVTERVETWTTEGAERLTFRLPLRSRFADGGWYWFDVLARRDDVMVSDAVWLDPDAQSPAAGGITIGVTTYNRPSFLVALLEQFASSQDVLRHVDEIIVVDQGTQKVRDQKGFQQARDALEGRVRLIEQPNVGGSGGFARSMHETLEAGRSRYVLLMDDDVRCEPEGIVRALAFADSCRRPTLVGGHMFNLSSPSKLQHFGEVVRFWRFHFTAAAGLPAQHDFRVAGLRSTSWMHRRVDVDYNAWWMCLIPTEVLKTVGLALPIFIKWDDAEYGIRAGKAGFPTVTLPGAAVWHMPFDDKDDNLDWQAYFHQRNRFIAALLHSPYERGGRLVRDSLYQQVYHLMSMQYSVCDLRIRALEDVLAGPGALHEELATKLPEVRAARAAYTDASSTDDLETLPPVVSTQRLTKDRSPRAPGGRVSFLLTMAGAALRQSKPVEGPAASSPEATVAAGEAKWWRLAHMDSAIVSASDGSTVSWYRREPATYRRMLKRSLELHRRLLTEWPELSQRYREAAGEITSAETWARTFLDLDVLGRESASTPG